MNLILITNRKENPSRNNDASDSGCRKSEVEIELGLEVETLIDERLKSWEEEWDRSVERKLEEDRVSCTTTDYDEEEIEWFEFTIMPLVSTVLVTL